MNRRTKLGLNVLEAALLLGVLGDALLRQTPWGLNVFLWAGALAAAMCALHGRSGGRTSWRADGGWLLLPIGFFAAAFAWRDSATLKFLDGLALFVAFALLAWRARGHNIRLGGLGDYALGLGHAAFDVMFASLPLAVSDVQWAAIPRRGAMRHVWAVARGLVIAVPLLFLFGALFMAADAVFEGIMRQTFELDAGQLFSHFFLTLLFAWMTGGFLRGMALAGDAAATVGAATQPPPTLSITTQPAHAAYTSITVDDREQDGAASASATGATGATREGETGAHRQSPGSVVVEGGATTVGTTVGGTTAAGAQEKEAKEAAARGFSLGAVEVGVVLGLLNVLFACFVVVQFRYFFGGAERVMSITELTYSEYARRGFFELTWVAGLVLPLLLGVHALLRRNSPAAGRIFRTLAGAQVALLFVIMTSAIARMRLYQSEYGLTELRLYTTAFMLWLGLVFVWFAWTVLVRDARLRFACGALVAAFLTVGLLHLLNPDAYIVRANAAHARAGRSFDAAYAASLSADAVPALVSALPALSRDERCLAASELTRRWAGRPSGEDWRAWSLARTRAWHTVAAHQASLSQATCPPPVSSVPVITPMTATEPPPPPKTTATNAGTTTNNANAATTNAATTSDAETNAETMRMINGTSGATAGVSNAAQATSAGNARARRRDRARVVKRTRTR
ncbi:MAG: hypothetical protein QOD28_489 [Acidobacteriota bacterium]|nr:hypothetical protein [Acidobacteriota bacterium]